MSTCDRHIPARIQSAPVRAGIGAGCILLTCQRTPGRGMEKDVPPRCAEAIALVRSEIEAWGTAACAVRWTDDDR
jgi:hypothetical protein